jgi:hypothetical protein
MAGKRQKGAIFLSKRCGPCSEWKERIFSVSKSAEGRKKSEETPDSWRIIDHTKEVHSFADTAALRGTGLDYFRGHGRHPPGWCIGQAGVDDAPICSRLAMEIERGANELVSHHEAFSLSCCRD